MLQFTLHIYNDDFTVLKFDMSFVVKKEEEGTANNIYEKKKQAIII